MIDVIGMGKFSMTGKRQRRFLEIAFFYYPFTISGTILFFFCLWLITNGLINQNPYNIFLSMVGFLILILFSAVGRISAVKITYQEIQWDSGFSVYAELDDQYHRVFLKNIKVPLFYRIHFRIRGKMAVGNGAFCYIFCEFSSPGKETLEIPLNFSFSGIAHVKGTFSLRDIFGITRARFGPIFSRTLVVRPAPLRAYRESFIRAIGGEEEKTTRKSTEEERYFMREYIPGDRFRDINWKASSRLSQLITRISPHSQEKTKTISVEFRHFWSQNRESRDSIAHLNLLKSALLYFLKKIKGENPGFTFMINTARGGFFLETEEDIENFGNELSTIFFEHEIKGNTPYYNAVMANVQGTPIKDALLEYKRTQSIHPGSNRGEVYIFSTPYDSNLQGILNLYRESEAYLFITTQERSKSTSEMSRSVKTYITLKLGSSHPISGLWAFRSDRTMKKLSIKKMPGVEIIELPLKTRLFQ